MNEISDQVKHIGDAVAIPGGVLTAIAWLSEVINPILSFVFLGVSLVWTILRIREMLKK